MFNMIRQQMKIRELNLALKEANLELEKLRMQNESMREGMRRCVTCDYRLESKQRSRKIPNLSESPE